MVLTYSQFYGRLWGFEVGRSQYASKPVLGLVYGSLLSVLILSATVSVKTENILGGGSDWAWIDVLYALGYVKLLVTFVKYIPQAWLNYKRKSTKGWSIWQILFDITGGVLSISQLIIDASFQADWSGITGNPLKFGLGFVSILFDLIFITQHYVLYRHPNLVDAKSSDDRLTEPLLGEG